MAQPQEGATQGAMRWIGARDLAVYFADHMWVQLIDGSIVLTFGRAELPFVSQTGGEPQRITFEGVEIKAVSRVAINADKIEQFAEALSRVNEARKQIPEIEPSPQEEEGS